MKKSTIIIAFSAFAFLFVGSASHTANIPVKQAEISHPDTVSQSMQKLELAISELDGKF